MSAEMLYEHDFVTWTEQQAGALREAARLGANLPLDWEHLAEEIEDLGSEIRTEVSSLTFQIQFHLLKIACSPAADQRPHGTLEVDELRTQLNRTLHSNHALRSRCGELLDAEWPRALKRADRTFRLFHEVPLIRLEAWKLRGISADEVRTDGLFPEPGTLLFRQEPD